MSPIVRSLNREWSEVLSTPRARRALMRWSANSSTLSHAHSLNDFVDTRTCPEWGRAAHLELAHRAPTDTVAARTLLQALLGGMVCLADQFPDRTDALDEIVSLSWNRIRTYPGSREGSVAGNVLLDVRKQYVRFNFDSRMTPGPTVGARAVAPEATPEDRACAGDLHRQLDRACQQGIVSAEALANIYRTRVYGESLIEVAASRGVSAGATWRQRSTAEARLRALPLAC